MLLQPQVDVLARLMCCFHVEVSASMEPAGDAQTPVNWAFEIGRRFSGLIYFCIIFNLLIDKLTAHRPPMLMANGCERPNQTMKTMAAGRRLSPRIVTTTDSPRPRPRRNTSSTNGCIGGAREDGCAAERHPIARPPRREGQFVGGEKKWHQQ